MRLLFVLALVAMLGACASTPGAPRWDDSPVPSAECEIIVSKDLGRIKYCRRGDYAEIFRLD